MDERIKELCAHTTNFVPRSSSPGREIRRASVWEEAWYIVSPKHNHICLLPATLEAWLENPGEQN
jgi:hypothetical protein